MLELQNITKVYGQGSSKIIALNDISLQVNQGELVAVLGPSGSGKSTFLSIAGALLQPTSGKVLVNNEDITAYNAEQLADVRLKNIGFILQSSNLVPYLTSLDQLLLVKRLTGNYCKEDVQKAEKLLEELGLSHRMNQFPEALSGGERQRVAIARAFMNDPDIILADEPTANLDSKRGREVVQMLSQEVKARNKAAVMVTHDERMLPFCDRVVRIEDGILIEVTAD